MNSYSAVDIIEAIGGHTIQQGDAATQFDKICIDSRKIAQPNSSIFFAIKGERNDGHIYIPSVYEKGIRFFITTETIDLTHLAGAWVVQVENAIEALQTLAAWHRKKFNTLAVGITGSNGKTIVKEWLYQLLSPSFHIVRSPKSYNSQIGVPLSVWRMNTQHNLALFEAGISMPDEMENLEKIIQPSIGVFTNIGSAHGKNFPSEYEKIREKLKLFKNCKTVIIPADDEVILKEWLKSGNPGEIIGWSFARKGNLNLRQEADGKLKCQWKGQSFEVQLPFFDEASIENISTCILTALVLGVTPETIVSRVPLLASVGMRLEMLQGVNNTLLVNDSYSADISSLEIALNFLDQQNHHKKKTLILSDILESGYNDTQLYQRIAKMAQEKGIDRVLAVGPRLEAAKDSFSQIETHFYRDTAHLIESLPDIQPVNESILIKGARVFEFEKITAALQQKIHETILEVNLGALVHNLNVFKKMAKTSKIMCMVKAAAYGSGSTEIARLLEYQRVDYLGVAYTNEGIDIRLAGVQLPIMVMNADPRGYQQLIEHRLEPEIYSLYQLEQFLHVLHAKPLETPYPIHLKLETGMHRLGFEESAIDTLIDLLKKNKKWVQVVSIFSHLAASDNPEDDAFTHKQLGIFKTLSDKIETSLGYPMLKHIANTAAIARFPEAHLDMVRLGIGLYGIAHIPANVGKLTPAARLKSHISQIKTISKGESIGYSRNFVAQNNMRIATIPIGYADGLSRSLSNGKFTFLINGVQAPTVGNVCMDMCMVDVTFVNCTEGDEVIIFDETQPIEYMAECMNSIPYEVLTGISLRVKRVFYQE